MVVLFSNGPCKRHYRLRVLRDNGEDDGWRITVNYHSLWVSFMFVVLVMDNAKAYKLLY